MTAANGVAGGLTSLAMGGTFQDGFIGSAIGAGVSSAMGAIPGLDVLEGPGVAKVIGRTAVASISGGVASVLAGGKFADGAYSAAFFHLFNDEMHRLDIKYKGSLYQYTVVNPERMIEQSTYWDADGVPENFQGCAQLPKAMGRMSATTSWIEGPNIYEFWKANYAASQMPIPGSLAISAVGDRGNRGKRGCEFGSVRRDEIPWRQI